MIDLVLLIRKTAPSHIKPQIKLANPDLLEKLVSIYPTLEGRVLPALVFELMTMAGPNWVAELTQRSRLNTASSGFKPEAGESAASATPPASAGKPKTRIYRGQIVPAAT